jgi:predicted dehydrogenase
MPAGDWVANGFTCLLSTDEPYPSLENDPPAADMDKDTFDFYLGFVNYYIHQVNFMRYLLGEDYRVAYADQSGVIFTTESDSGITGIVEMSPYSTTIDWQESALVAFEHGWVKVSLPAPLAHNRAGVVEMFSDPGGGITPRTVVPQMPWIHAMRQQAMNFVSAIRGEMKPLCEAADGLKDLQIARDYVRLVKGK